MILTTLLLCAITFAESQTLLVQVALDHAGYSCNTIDGQWGTKSQRALEAYCRARNVAVPATPEEAAATIFADRGAFLRDVTVTATDVSALTRIPAAAAAKAALPRMGYETLAEMLAERGHVSVRALQRLNPLLDLRTLVPGQTVTLPDFPSIEEELAAGERRCRGLKTDRPEAARIVISTGRFEIAVKDRDGRTIALFPCSIARDKSKVPPHGELKITSYVANPNYTYTPDRVPKGGKAARHVWPAGPNCPVGVAWMGLNLPGYGMHGTPRPETIGSAESHGCFRLSNWNAARLFALCRPGTRVTICP